jgi:DNA-binding winged helix-turn-helix (wHTH) protein
MSAILLIGFDHPESLRFLEELKHRAPQHEFLNPSALGNSMAGQDSIAMLWCSRSGSETAGLVAAAVGEGLPAVALLRDLTVEGIDFSRGHIEVVFGPFDPDETIARIAAVLARSRESKEENVLRHGELVIDQDRYEVTLSGRKIDLTYKEYELLKYLAARPGRVFSREALLRSVWEYDYFGGTRTVDVHVRRLRSKIDDVRNGFIETVWNVGYRFRSADGSATSPPSGRASG